MKKKTSVIFIRFVTYAVISFLLFVGGCIPTINYLNELQLENGRQEVIDNQK